MKWKISDDCLQADSIIRQRVVIIDKKVNPPPIMYQPLYMPLQAKPITNMMEVLKIKVAVYKLDERESKNRPFNFYFYKGDEWR